MQTTRYQVTPLDPNAHVFEVRCTVDDPDPAGQRFRLPTWIPGSYLIREFARQFVHVRAEAAGAPFRSPRKSKARLARSPGERPLTVVAKVYACDLSVRTAYLDQHARLLQRTERLPVPCGREARRAPSN